MAAAPAGDSKAPSAPRSARPRVARSLQSMVDWVKGRGGAVSAQVIDTQTGSVWAEASPNAALNPASNMKVLTAAVALDRLGSEFRFSTGLYGSVEAGTIGTLVLRGHGDPSLSTRDLWQLASALASLGVERVGAILVDQSRFDAEFVPPAFAQQPDEWASFRAPVSAVALERNAVTLCVLPSAAGQPARAWFEPGGIVTQQGAVETRPPGSGEGITLMLRSEGDRVQREIAGYASLSQAAMTSMKIIADSLGQWNPQTPQARRVR